MNTKNGNKKQDDENNDDYKPENQEEKKQDEPPRTDLQKSIDVNVEKRVNDPTEKEAITRKDDATASRDVTATNSQLYLNATNTLITAGQQLPTAIYNHANVAPTINSINPGYEKFSEYKYNDAFSSMSGHMRIKCYDSVRHFYALKLDTNSGGEMPIIVDTAINTQRTELCKTFAQPFEKGFNQAYIAIDSNLPGFEIAIDPIKGDGLDFLPIDDILQIVATIQGMTPSINGDTTLFKYWALAIKVISLSPYVGCFMYYQKSKDDAFTAFNNLIQQTDFGPTLVVNPAIDDCAGDFYTTRYAINNIPDERYLSAITGSVPRDDYTRYPRIEYMQNGLPTEWMRVASYNETTVPIEFGQQTDTAQTLNNFKYKEMCIVGSDVVTDQLQRNTMAYIKTTTIEIDNYVELINSMMLRATDFAGGNYQYQYVQYTAELSNSINESLADESVSFFPATPDHMFAFKAVEALSPSTLMQTFGSIKEMSSNILSRFEFKSIADMQSTIVDSTTLQNLPTYNTRITQLISRLGLTTPSGLATKMALDMMSLYVIATPSTSRLQYSDVVGSSINFGMDLRALMITFFLTPNYFIRNESMWISLLHNFFSSYTNEAYVAFFTTFGYGYRDGIKITSLKGINRMNSEGVTWSLNANVKSSNKLFEALKNMLSLEALSENKMLHEMDIPETRYRWPRKVRLPGQPYLPEFTDVIRQNYPMTSMLFALQTHIESYVIAIQEKGLKPNERFVESALVARMIDFAYQFGSWFHLVYCPTYAAIAKSCPLLIRSDTLPSNAYLAMYDSVETVYGDKVRLLTTPYALKYCPQGSVVALPVETNTIFSPRCLFEASYLFMCASPVNTSLNGASLVQNMMTTIDNSPYQIWFTRDLANFYLQKYLVELQSRFILYESICMNVELIYGDFLDASVSWVSDVMNQFSRVNKPTSMGMVYLRKLFGWDFGNDNVALSKVNDITSMLLKDPRYFCPTSTIALVARVFAPVAATTLPYRNIIRPYIKANSNLLLDRLFGKDNGIFKKYTGVSISIESLQGPLTFSSKHRSMRKYLEYFYRPVVNIDAVTFNTTQTHKYRIYHLENDVPVVEEDIFADSVHAFIDTLESLTINVPKPFLTVRVNRTLVKSEYEVYYELYTLGYLSFTIPNMIFTPTHRFCTYSEAMNNSALTKDEIMRFLTIIPNLSHTSLELVDTRYTFRSAVPTTSRRNVLPLQDDAIEPEVKIVATNFNTTANINTHTLYIDSTVPVLVKDLNMTTSQCKVDDDYVDTAIAYPYALRVMTTVWYAIPFVPYQIMYTESPVEALV